MTTIKNVIPIAKATIHPEGSQPMTLEYYLRCYTGPEGEDLYGMRIDMRHIGGDLAEREETAALSGCVEDVTVLVNAFAEGTVTPCVLHEMVEEWFCPQEKKFRQAQAV